MHAATMSARLHRFGYRGLDLLDGHRGVLRECAFASLACALFATARALFVGHRFGVAKLSARAALHSCTRPGWAVAPLVSPKKPGPTLGGHDNAEARSRKRRCLVL
jgi:hypothetical protein